MHSIEEGKKLDKIKEHLKRNAFAYSVGLAVAGLIGAKAIASKRSQEISVNAAGDIVPPEINKKLDELNKVKKEFNN
jgi:hypothetical protein